jgi:hypothetical protein
MFATSISRVVIGTSSNLDPVVQVTVVAVLPVTAQSIPSIVTIMSELFAMAPRSAKAAPKLSFPLFKVKVTESPP